jgi:hypothetical protein
MGLRCLQQAYPQQICAVSNNELVLCTGQHLTYDDGRNKTHAERLDDPDLEDTMAVPYDVAAVLPPGPDVEPGRVRYLPLFDAMYGATESQARAKLRTITWLPNPKARKLEVTTVNGVDQRLQAVAAALARLDPTLRVEIARVAGTFSFRSIAGTSRKSAHSYGIAIDVAPQLADYWRWREPGVDPPQRYRNRLPLEVVSAFEREGFIWGGRWSHYDTMHFEYRPELLVPECRVATPNAPAWQPQFSWPLESASQPLRERIAPPPGYQRVVVDAHSFGAWLREIPVRPADEPVLLYDGRRKPAQDLHVAVVDIDVGKRDLQQCADAVMRLRAEYLFANGRRDEICFRAVSGDALPYASYRRGLRPAKGSASAWAQRAAASDSWTGFRQYLNLVFGIANTASLARELEPVRDPRTLVAGDVYIEAAHAARFGHAVLVLDVAQNAAGERVFLIAQSYMPAQQIHVLRNPNQRELGPWYRAPQDASLATPEWLGR